MKKILLIGILLSAFQPSKILAQDLVSGGANSWIFHTPDDGRTTLHIAPLVNGNWNWNAQSYFSSNGDVNLSGNIHIPLSSSIGHLQLIDKFTHNGNTIGNYSLGWANDSWLNGAPTSYYSGYGGIKFFTQSSPRLVIDYSGNVGIGTTDPGSFKLAVNGKTWTTEVQVAVNRPPDYVFEPTYHLSPLDSIKTYIDKNKHLPEVPSAKEMEKNGVNLGEMNMLLLKKIEELTLYVIEQNKTIQKQNERLQSLEELNRKTK
jgi:hypothetical protein